MKWKKSLILKRTFALIASLLILSVSFGCTTTDSDEAEDIALEGSSSGQESTETEEQAVSDFDNSEEQPTAETPMPSDSEGAEATASDEGAPAPEASGTDSSESADISNADASEVPSANETEDQQEAIADPFAGQEALSAEDPQAVANEEIVAAATEEVATDSPAEPAVIEEGAPVDTQQQTPVDPFARFDNPESSDATQGETGSEPANIATPDSSENTTDPFGAPAGEESLAQTGLPDASVDPFAAEPQSAEPNSQTNSAPARQSNFGTTSELEYLVAPGDTLSEIAEKIYGSPREWQTIAESNSLRAPFVIFPGDVLKIATFDSAASYAQAYQNVPEELITVQKGETLSSISKRLLGSGNSWKYLWKINEAEIPNPNVLKPGQVIRFKDFRNIQVSL